MLGTTMKGRFNHGLDLDWRARFRLCDHDGGRGPAALFGAAGGAAVGASVSQGHSETRRYDVTAQFDDGTRQTFSYGSYSPFIPGEADHFATLRSTSCT
jgi:outer membrane lipoprotein SlyB